MRKRFEAKSTTFRLPAEVLKWLEETARQIESRPEQVGRVTSTDVLLHILMKAMTEGRYGKAQNS
jgi:hypothetical protein